MKIEATAKTARSVAAAIMFAACAAGCGAENFVPSSSAEYENRGGAETVLVLDNSPSDTKGYARIGTALAHAKSQAAALRACRQIAANNGGDAVLLPEAKTPRDWDCVVLRAEVPHSGQFQTKKPFVVHERPDGASPEIAKLPAGTMVDMQRRENNWVKIQWDTAIDESMRGWVRFDE